MELYLTNNINPNIRYIKKTSELLKNGEVCLYPTDVNYGFGASLNSIKGVKKLNLLSKKFERTKYHTLLCKDFSNISEYANIDNNSFRLMKKILPGPFTVILEATKLVPKICQTKRKTIGIRIIDSPVVMSLIEEINSPILNITAISNEEDYLIENPEEIIKRYQNDVSSFINVGSFPFEKTTVLDLSGRNIDILREGLGKLDFI
jgi:tRNA threonylcarbamoyl adenosine modification protein (Sua5/YciO/YrdC/YwlC family)